MYSVNVPSKSNKQKKTEKKKEFFVGISKVTDEKSRIRIPWSEVQIRGSESIQNGTALEHWCLELLTLAVT